MNKKILVICGLGTAVAGGLLAAFTRDAALAGEVDLWTVLFALGLILVLAGLAAALAAFQPRQKKADVGTVTMAALFAALCYIGFAYLRIDIPVGTEKTAFHLGNVFCVLAALFLGSFWGGMSGAIGLTLADFTSGYLTSAPKTFLLKLCIGAVTGFVAHRLFHISREEETRVRLERAWPASPGWASTSWRIPWWAIFIRCMFWGSPRRRRTFGPKWAPSPPGSTPCWPWSVHSCCTSPSVRPCGRPICCQNYKTRPGTFPGRKKGGPGRALLRYGCLPALQAVLLGEGGPELGCLLSVIVFRLCRDRSQPHSRHQQGAQDQYP